MSLRRVAERDLGSILSDTRTGFGWPIVVTDPLGNRFNRTGFSNDIYLLIDPDTGQAVSGRTASVALQISSLPDIPVGVSDTASRPWLVEFADIGGRPWRFRVSETNPDRTLGLIVLILELYG